MKNQTQTFPKILKYLKDREPVEQYFKIESTNFNSFTVTTIVKEKDGWKFSRVIKLDMQKLDKIFECNGSEESSEKEFNKINTEFFTTNI